MENFYFTNSSTIYIAPSKYNSSSQRNNTGLDGITSIYLGYVDNRNVVRSFADDSQLGWIANGTYYGYSTPFLANTTPLYNAGNYFVSTQQGSNLQNTNSTIE